MFERKFKPIPLEYENKKNKKISRIARGVLAITLAGSGIGITGKIAAEGFSLPYQFLTECSNPNESVINRVKNELNTNYENPPLKIDEYKNYTRDRAKESNFDLIDPKRYTEEILQAKSTEDVLYIVNNYTNNFDFDINIPKEKSAIDNEIGFSIIEYKNINLETFKSGTINFINTLSYWPTSLLKAANLDKLNLVNITGKDEFTNKEYIGQFSYMIGSMYLDLEKFINKDIQSTIFAHELSHSLDSTFCGMPIFSTDKNYENLNNSTNFKYGINNNFNFGNVISEYGGKNIEEDKATLLENILNKNLIYANLNSILQNKTVLLLARLEEKVPNITKYLKQISFNNGV